MTDIRTALNQAAHSLAAVSESSALDAEVLLAFVLGKERSFLRAWPEKQLDDEQLARYRRLIEKRTSGAPIAYLVGKREFWSRDFQVNAAVLIPRPETELLVELALGSAPENTPLQLLDLGAGSGIIAITLAAERPATEVLGVDICAAALRIAQTNAARLGVKNVRFLRSDWFAQIPPSVFDIIVGNPPYIAPGDPHLRQGDVRFEPQGALVSAQQGLGDIARIVAGAKVYLKPDGHLLLEHGYDQQDAVQSLFRQQGYAQIRTHCDLAGQPRITAAQKV
jgi:release factor glutamine methyltransferase